MQRRTLMYRVPANSFLLKSRGFDFPLSYARNETDWPSWLCRDRSTQCTPGTFALWLKEIPGILNI
jgi:hypothetical protein